jgi:hypothetical protein
VPTAPTTPVDTSDAPDAGGPGDAGVRRTIVQRNPFGNVAKTENLLWDGDFEWSSAFTDQYGWINYPQVSYGFQGIRVGIECRSGLKCASIDHGRGIIGIGVSSEGYRMSASFWARPLAEASCEDISADLLSITGEDPTAPVPLVPEAADDGWCRFEGVADERVTKTYLLIDNGGKGEVLVDDVVLERVMKTQALTVPVEPPTAARSARVAEARAALRARRGPIDPPPNAAKRALERWAGRR